MLGAIAGPIATIGAALIGGHGQSQANTANAAEAERNRQFQERMRSTQYQTAVEDLKKAGLNPALAYSQGGAGNLAGSTPAPMQNTAANAASSAASALATIQDMRRTAAEIEKIHAETDLTKNQTQVANLDWILKNLQSVIGHRTVGETISRIKSEATTAASTAREAEASASIRQLQIPEAQAIAAFYRSMMGKAAPFIGSAGAAAAGINRVFQLFRR